MTDLTPERVRDAAEVVQQFGWKDEAAIMREHAKDMEREQAAEAKREKLTEDLANWLYQNIGKPGSPLVVTTSMYRDAWMAKARELITRYPALAEAATDA
jgi:hypothetical protein